MSKTEMVGNEELQQIAMDTAEVIVGMARENDVTCELKHDRDECLREATSDVARAIHRATSPLQSALTASLSREAALQKEYDSLKRHYDAACEVVGLKPHHSISLGGKIMDREAALVEAVEKIAAMHLGDQPMTSEVSQYGWAVQHIAKIRKIAVDALKPATAA